MTNLFLSLLEISIPISLMIILLLLLTPFFEKRYAARWKYWIWVVLALRLLIPLGGGGGMPSAALRPQGEMTAALETGPAPQAAAAEKAEKTAPETPADAAPGGRVIVELPAQMTAPIAASSNQAGNSVSWLDVIAWIWMAGSAAMLCVPLAGYCFYRRRLRKKGSAVADGDILRLLQELKQELRIERAVSVIEYPEAISPMLTGFFGLVIVLPKERYTAQELYFIVKHELVHLKRGDLYGKLLFAVVRAVYWFDPLIWVMQKEAAIDMELSCDDRVIRDAGYAERKAYTETLFSALHKQSAKKVALTTSFYGGKQIMKKRFETILGKTGKKSGVAVLVCAAVLAMSLGTLAGCSIVPGSTAAAPGLSGAPTPSTGAGPAGVSGRSDAAGPAGVPGRSDATGPAAASGSADAGNIQAGGVQSESRLQNPAEPIAFVAGMGCSDPTCTDASHHHDCPADCADYEHHHTCALDCTEAGHHHSAAAPNDFSGSGSADNSGNSGSLGNAGNSGNSNHSGGHHNESGHHSPGHHG